MDMAWHDPRLNLAKAEAMIEEAADRNADIAVLPEMSMSGFSMDIEKAAEPRNGISVKGLANIAKQYKMNIIAGLSLREKGQEKACNSALIYTSDGNILGEYKKCHPFTPAGEDIRYEAGLEPVVFNLAGADSSVFICYDLRFPELMRSVAESVQVMYIIANWPAGRARHWHTLLTARAIENQCFVIGLNRTGTDGNNIGYNGESLVVGPTGMIMLRSGVAEGVELIEFDPKEALQARAEFSALRDRKF
jgi:predicted amidohydrolase